MRLTSTGCVIGLSGAFFLGCAKQEPPRPATVKSDDDVLVTAVREQQGDPGGRGKEREAGGRPATPSGREDENPFSGLDPFRSRELPPATLPNPEDFFPTVVWSSWTYRITLGKQEPLWYGLMSWPLGGKRVSYDSRGLFAGVDPRNDNEGKAFSLVMRVERPAAAQGRTRYGRGVELAVRKDELGVFEGSKQVFFTINPHNRLMAELVVTHPADASGIPGAGESESRRIVFFWDGWSRRSISLANSGDYLLFTGLDKDVPDNPGLECLHFLRAVKPVEEKRGGDASHLEQGFTEDLWYARAPGARAA